MALKNKNSTLSLASNVLRISRLHFYYTFIFALSIVITDAWKLITPSAVLQRWTVAAAMLVVTTIVWYASRASSRSSQYYKLLAYALILMDIGVAAFMVYAERGMASRGVALFAIPILVSAILNTRSALFATAALSVAAYSFAAVRYFVVNFNEGYKIELYSVIAFYGACFFVLAAILWSILESRN